MGWIINNFLNLMNLDEPFSYFGLRDRCSLFPVIFMAIFHIKKNKQQQKKSTLCQYRCPSTYELTCSIVHPSRNGKQKPHINLSLDKSS